MPKSRVRRCPFPEAPPAAQLATAADAVPDGDSWGHEIKIDGYRMLCRRAGDEIRFISRNGKDWTANVGPLGDTLLKLPADEFIIDGEVAVTNETGVTDFQKLQNTIRRPNPVGLIYFVFDVLHVADLDLKPATLPERKDALREILAEVESPNIQFSDCIVGNGPAVFESARALGVEGVVSKRLSAPYRSGRSDAWLKIKYNQRSEFVVVGFTDSESVDHALGAMMLAEPAGDGSWRYVGRVGTGFSQATLQMLRDRLLATENGICPLPEHPADIPVRDSRWVEPEMVVEIEFNKRSDKGTLRFPSFKGLRDDITVEDL